MVKKKNIWTNKEEEKLKKFILEKKKVLISNFYENLLSFSCGYKIKTFFKDMSKFICKKSIIDCKTKFKKCEYLIYTEYLNIPQIHFQLYLFLWKLKKICDFKIKDGIKIII